MADRTRDINYFYPKPESTGYFEALTQARFSVLKDLEFKSVLDVGSGCCRLLSWLRDSEFTGKYEAVDIREDALALCDCKTHTSIPKRNKYDLVVLFGTVTYNIGENHKANKEVLSQLLAQAAKSAKKHIVFTVIREDRLQGLSKLQMVGYSREEVEDLASALGTFKIIENVDPDEYVVVVDL